MKKKLFITDIASKLNISITTVSFILNGKAEEKRISKDLKEKVIQLVKELNYKPNQLAKSLRTGKTYILAFIVEDIANAFFNSIARLIEEKAYSYGYRIIYGSTGNSPEKTKELISMFRDRHVDGYIITPSEGVEKEIKELQEDDLPVLLFDRYLPELATNYVIIDNYGCTFNATNYLLQQGFNNVCFVTTHSGQTQMTERFKGYEKAIIMHKKELLLKKVKHQDEQEVMINDIKNYILQHPEIESIIFATNYLGLYGNAAIKRLNLKVPDDIGVITFDDHDIFQLTTPTISVIQQPVQEISNHIIRILLGNIGKASKDRKQEKVILPGNLVIRESSQQIKVVTDN